MTRDRQTHRRRPLPVALLLSVPMGLTLVAVLMGCGGGRCRGARDTRCAPLAVEAPAPDDTPRSAGPYVPPLRGTAAGAARPQEVVAGTPDDIDADRDGGAEPSGHRPEDSAPTVPAASPGSAEDGDPPRGADDGSLEATDGQSSPGFPAGSGQPGIVPRAEGVDGP